MSSRDRIDRIKSQLLDAIQRNFGDMPYPSDPLDRMQMNVELEDILQQGRKGPVIINDEAEQKIKTLGDYLALAKSRMEGKAASYLEGFLLKCAEYGMDPERLVKSANKWKRFLTLMNDAVKRYEVGPGEYIGEGTLYSRGPRGVALGSAVSPRHFADVIGPTARAQLKLQGGYSDKPIYRKFKDTGKNWLGMKKELPLMTDKDIANQTAFAKSLMFPPSSHLTGEKKLEPETIARYIAGKQMAMKGFNKI